MSMLNMVVQYNSVIEGNDLPIEIDSKIYEGFYVSYNNYDVDIYGCETTALVIGQMQKFYILNGDHRKQYGELIKQGFQECLNYYKNNIKDANKYSDKLVN